MVGSILYIIFWMVSGAASAALYITVRECTLAPPARTPHEYGPALLLMCFAPVGAILSGMGAAVCLSRDVAMNDCNAGNMFPLNAFIFCVSAAISHRVEYSRPRQPAVRLR